MMFFDIDEFLEIDNTRFKNIKQYLSQSKFNNYNCIRVCWKTFTDNGLLKVENNNYSVDRFKEPLTTALCDNRITRNNVYSTQTQTKSILRTVFKRVSFSSPHGIWNKSIVSCDATGIPCNNGISIGKIIWKDCWLNHYRFKTI